jgi:RNA polymerase sigma-70 factor (ECF subfamily)
LKEDSKISDFEIVQRIVNHREKHLYTIIYDRYADLVYNRCYSFSNTNAEAKDLTQDVFIKAYLKLNTFTQNVSFKSWLYTLAYRFCVNYVNRNNERKMEQKAINIDDISDLKITVSDDVLNDMEVTRLEKSLELISPEDKMILLLKYQDDVTIKELALSLEIGQSAVKMRLKRAKSKLVEVYNKTF